MTMRLRVTVFSLVVASGLLGLLIGLYGRAAVDDGLTLGAEYEKLQFVCGYLKGLHYVLLVEEGRPR